jgi:hypothetical protein
MRWVLERWDGGGESLESEWEGERIWFRGIGQLSALLSSYGSTSGFTGDGVGDSGESRGRFL